MSKNKTPHCESAIQLDGIGRATVKNVSISGAKIGLDFKNMNEADVQGFDYVGDGQAFVGQNIGKVNLSDIRVGSKDLKDLLLSDAELRSRFETVAEDMRKAETEREALEVLKQSQFGKWLAKQKFVDWARLVFSIWTDGS